MKKIVHLTIDGLRQMVKEALMEHIMGRSGVLEEGLDIDRASRTISFNPEHEENVDTSLENNPTRNNQIVPDIDVWSIFKRKRGYDGDGNPLIYALKGEGWRFRSQRDEELIKQQFDAVAEKFASLYPIENTIIIPSSNYLNKYIAKVVTSKCEDAEILEGAILKMNTEEIDDIVTFEDNCMFRQVYKNNFNDAYRELRKYLDRMDAERDGQFTRHFITNGKMRDTLDRTLKSCESTYAEYAKKINGRNVLLIDDTISRGQTIKEACKIIQDTYAPKSITVLTLLSKLE